MGVRSIVNGFFKYAFFCGLGFMIVKSIEWGEKIYSGVTINSSEFYMFYFVLTGVHLLHVTVGMCVLGYFIKQSQRGFDQQTSKGRTK